MKKYKQISVIIESCGKYRLFTTESFTIRPIVVYLQRFNPNFQIFFGVYGKITTCGEVTNTQWAEKQPLGVKYEGETFHTHPAECDNFKKFALENWPYRVALNEYYLFCAKNGIYPSKQPFAGVTVDTIPEKILNSVGTCERPRFLPDTENPCAEKSDILKWYDGKRIEKYVNGYRAEGYFLQKIRLENKKPNENN